MKRLVISVFVLFILISCSTKEIKWVALGDSITYLNDHKDETGNRLTKGYLTQVVEARPDITYTNMVKNGWTAVRVANEIENLDIEPADLYTVFLGTNDWWAGKPIGTINDYSSETGNDTFYGSYKTIVNKLRSLNANARIILITPMQRVDFVYINDFKNNAFGSYSEKGGQTLSQLADAVNAIGNHEGFDVVDLYNDSGMTLEHMVKFRRLRKPETSEYSNYIYPDFIEIPFNPETDEYPYPPEAIDMTYDGLHPSDSGNEVIARRRARTGEAAARPPTTRRRHGRGGSGGTLPGSGRGSLLGGPRTAAATLGAGREALRSRSRP
jgi:lysophospholipase L1-like esterase